MIPETSATNKIGGALDNLSPPEAPPQDNPFGILATDTPEPTRHLHARPSQRKKTTLELTTQSEGTQPTFTGQRISLPGKAIGDMSEMELTKALQPFGLGTNKGNVEIKRRLLAGNLLRNHWNIKPSKSIIKELSSNRRKTLREFVEEAMQGQVEKFPADPEAETVESTTTPPQKVELKETSQPASPTPPSKQHTTREKRRPPTTQPKQQFVTGFKEGQIIAYPK